MSHPFQVGDRVVFHKTDLTRQFTSSQGTIIKEFERGIIKTFVVKILRHHSHKGELYPYVKAYIEGENKDMDYYLLAGDIRLAYNEDELFLQKLIGGDAL